MEKEDIKQVLLQIFEVQLEYQLRAIRQLQGKTDNEPILTPKGGRRRQSIVDLCLKILTEEGKPLHVNELALLLQQRFGGLTDRGTLSSALAKKPVGAFCCVRVLRPLLLSLIPRRIIMKQPDLRMLAHWLDPALVTTLETRRRLKKEWHRQRMLPTLQTLWLMLAVSLDT